MMDAKARQMFEWVIREAGFKMSLKQMDDLWRIVSVLTDAEYERGYDEGSSEIDDPRDLQ